MTKLSVANGYYTPNMVSLPIRFATAITHLALMYSNASCPFRKAGLWHDWLVQFPGQ